jgi:hypothetical protein
MQRVLTIRRWNVELHRRAICVTETPNPNCLECNGRGGWYEPHPMGPDPVACHCLDGLRNYRIPLWPRTKTTYAEEVPF